VREHRWLPRVAKCGGSHVVGKDKPGRKGLTVQLMTFNGLGSFNVFDREVVHMLSVNLILERKIN
jgi:hypothetical protein